MKQTGFFDDIKREYVITNMQPLRPLINYLWSEEVVCTSDQFGFGSCFSYVNTVRRELDGKERLVYIKDKQTGEVFSGNRNYDNLPFDKHVCHVGLGYQKIESQYKKIATTFTISVPKQDLVELFCIDVENLDNTDKDLSVYFYVRPQPNLTWHTSYGTGDYDIELKGLYYPHFGFDLPHPYQCVYFACDKIPYAYDVADENFKGVYNSLQSPIGLKQDRLSCKGTTFEDDFCGAMQFDIKLKAGEKQSFYFALGTECSYEKALKAAKKYATKKAFEENLLYQVESSRVYSDVFTVNTQDSYINSMTNIWLKRQLSLGKTWGRICGKGFRDVMQDITAFVSFDPELAKKRILYALKHQYINGNPIRMYEPDFTHPYYDGAAWIPATLLSYVKETGDTAILQEMVKYLDRDIYESVFDHTYRGLRFLLDKKGEHGLTLFGGGDWNDSLNNVGMKGRGESVWLSIATYKAVREFIELTEFVGGNEPLITILKRDNQILKDNILKHGFDGEYFIYGYTDDGEKIGSKESEEGKLYLNPQTWAVLAGLCDEQTNHKIMDIVENNLKCKFGYMQLAPSYTKGDDSLGRVSYFVPGMVENGSVYNHGVTFKIVADCLLSRGDLAYETIHMISAHNPHNANSGMEPYAISNMFIGPENPYKVGKAPMSWVTGSAGWLYRAITEYLFGVTAEFCGLKIKPCLPSKIGEVSLSRVFRGATYKIKLIASDKDLLIINGKEQIDNIVPLQKSGTLTEVICYYMRK